ncbi:MAG: hypothetical protein LH461_11410 [Spirochaetaceae bacterium]|nr:hypothetical protein [Spirochaetaceae bacterium]
MSTDDVERNAEQAEDPLVRDYLVRLADAGRILPADRRAEVLADVREHLRHAVATEELPGSSREVAVRTALDRLGPPEEIVRAEAEQSGMPDRPRGIGGMQRYGDPIAVVLLLFGGFLLGVGWLVGLALLWMSDSWRVREKLMGTLVWPFGYAGVALIGPAVAFTEACTSTGTAVGSSETTCTGGLPYPDWVGVLMSIVVLAAPVVMAALLWRRRAALLAERGLV